MGEPAKLRRLAEVAGLFLKLGTLSFGGPAAHIGFMEREVVQKRRWLDRESFLELLAVTNLVPGPNSTEMAAHIGFVRAGWTGLVAGGAAFILPAFFISLLLAIAYRRYGALPQVSALFYGINPAVLAVIFSATYRLGRSAVKDLFSAGLGLVCLAAALAGVNEAIVLLAAGALSLLYYTLINRSISGRMLSWAPLLIAAAGITSWWENRLAKLGLFFLKVGSLLFGSGMVLFAFIQRDVVSGYGWLTQQQLLDAIAVGQMTPGPVLSAVTFIGYLVADIPGAVVSTAAVFFPSFVIVAATGPWLSRLRQSPWVQAFLRGVNVAVVALILKVGIALVRSAVVDIWTGLILLAGLVFLLVLRSDTVWIVLGGAAVGFIRFVLGQAVY